MQRKHGFAEQHSKASVSSSVGAGELTSSKLDGVGAQRPKEEGGHFRPPHLDPSILRAKEEEGCKTGDDRANDEGEARSDEWKGYR